MPCSQKKLSVDVLVHYHNTTIMQNLKSNGPQLRKQVQFVFLATNTSQQCDFKKYKIKIKSMFIGPNCLLPMTVWT